MTEFSAGPAYNPNTARNTTFLPSNRFVEKKVISEKRSVPGTKHSGQS